MDDAVVSVVVPMLPGIPDLAVYGVCRLRMVVTMTDDRGMVVLKGAVVSVSLPDDPWVEVKRAAAAVLFSSVLVIVSVDGLEDVANDSLVPVLTRVLWGASDGVLFRAWKLPYVLPVVFVHGAVIFALMAMSGMVLEGVEVAVLSMLTVAVSSSPDAAKEWHRLKTRSKEIHGGTDIPTFTRTHLRMST